MLLNYISSGLPELDVNHVTQMRMDQIIPYLMHSAWKKKYRIVSDREDAKFKSRLEFAEALDRFLSDWRLEHISLEDIRDEKLGLILSSGNLSETFRANSGLSILQLEKLFNARIASRIRFLCSETEEERAELMKKYKNYYHSDQKKRDVTEIYISFLETLEDGTDRRSFEKSKEEVRKGEYDIYDAAAVALIWKRLLVKKDEDEFSQIIIDEAQDYGEAVYYALRKLMPACNFTVMGDGQLLSPLEKLPEYHRDLGIRGNGSGKGHAGRLQNSACDPPRETGFRENGPQRAASGTAERNR